MLPRRLEISPAGLEMFRQGLGIDLQPRKIYLQARKIYLQARKMYSRALEIHSERSGIDLQALGIDLQPRKIYLQALGRYLQPLGRDLQRRAGGFPPLGEDPRVPSQQFRGPPQRPLRLHRPRRARPAAPRRLSRHPPGPPRRRRRLPHPRREGLQEAVERAVGKLTVHSLRAKKQGAPLNLDDLDRLLDLIIKVEALLAKAHVYLPALTEYLPKLLGA